MRRYTSAHSARTAGPCCAAVAACAAAGLVALAPAVASGEAASVVGGVGWEEWGRMGATMARRKLESAIICTAGQRRQHGKPSSLQAIQLAGHLPNTYS